MPLDDETRRRLIRDFAKKDPEKFAEAYKMPLTSRWMLSGVEGMAEGLRRKELLEHVRGMATYLVPDMEKEARLVVSLISWPQGMGRCPTFDEVMRAGVCPKCNGTGDEGFTMRIRCRECGGTG